jgi:hypothetical protein
MPDPWESNCQGGPRLLLLLFLLLLRLLRMV